MGAVLLRASVSPSVKGGWVRLFLKWPFYDSWVVFANQQRLRLGLALAPQVSPAPWFDLPYDAPPPPPAI